MPSQRTTQPIVTGTSVLAIKYNGGVALMADTLGSYGSMSMFKSICRLHKVNNNTLIGAGGEFSDFQFIQNNLQSLNISDYCLGDGYELRPRDIHNWLGRVMYNRRSRVNPLWNQFIVSGFHNNQSFLGYVDMYGTIFEDNTVATGYGAYLAAPILRKGWTPDLTQQQARQLLIQAMTVLYYRDCRTINNYQIGFVSESGVQISDPFKLDNMQWELKRFIQPDLSS